MFNSHVTHWTGRLAGSGLLCLHAACAGDAAQSGELRIERITQGDTTIVRHHGDTSGEPGLRLAEEIRIGALEGSDTEIFGRISAVAPDGKGGAYVFDGQVPALRHYDAEGTYTRTLGGRGGGPGEYQDATLGLWVLRDGRVLLREPRNARINIYAPDGAPVDHWPVASGLFTSGATVVDTAGHVYLKVLLGRPERNRPWPIALMHMNPAGEVVDTIMPPEMPDDPQSTGGTFTVEKVWTFSPHGYMIAGVNRTYSFELHKPEGTVRVEMPHTPVAVNPDERAEREASNDFLRRTQGQFMTADIPPVPETKPAYRAIYTGLDGRIWVHLYTAAVKTEPPPRPPAQPGDNPLPPQITWREPTVYDVFEPDGSWIGRLRVPERTGLVAMNGGEIWGSQRGELDEQYLVRFRLVMTHEPER